MAAPPFMSAIALARATSRARKALKNALPKTLRRRKAVHWKLYQTEVRDGVDLSPKPQATPKRSAGTSDETVCLIQQFYQRDDISRQAPGKKDVVNVRDENGQKVKFQTRHVTSLIMETYTYFL